ncbi:arginine deiminase-related protein [Flavobacteriaceae bacterium]|nr:arginine deiminase-related protein [Flavobacteriaceae bacterium]MDA9929138.1 arginine deiminase-related protein [Flavobacteriaceae bacterium]MDC1473721.1 arginine deiminase-related protein [Flavobacteriaceae bacterium]
MKQLTNHILMIRPAQFRMNEQTAVNNYFQAQVGMTPEAVEKKAQEEFDTYVSVLREKGVQVTVVQDTLDPDTPDALFPNNWVSFHQDATVALYPMFAENRRLERREAVLEILEEDGFIIDQVMDYTAAEDSGIFLEGTGSLILDRVHKKAYCALSSRADEELFIEFCEDFEYTPVIFTANQTEEGKRLPIYHTNVMMCLAETFAVICSDSIDDKKARKAVLNHLKEDGKEVIAISEVQMHSFAGNMLQVLGSNETPYLVMSTTAYESLQPDQLSKIRKHCEIIHADLSTIETCGGGSARCMMAEVFLPRMEN